MNDTNRTKFDNGFSAAGEVRFGDNDDSLTVKLHAYPVTNGAHDTSAYRTLIVFTSNVSDDSVSKFDFLNPDGSVRKTFVVTEADATPTIEDERDLLAAHGIEPGPNNEFCTNMRIALFATVKKAMLAATVCAKHRDKREVMFCAMMQDEIRRLGGAADGAILARGDNGQTAVVPELPPMPQSPFTNKNGHLSPLADEDVRVEVLDSDDESVRFVDAPCYDFANCSVIGPPHPTDPKLSALVDYEAVRVFAVQPPVFEPLNDLNASLRSKGFVGRWVFPAGGAVPSQNEYGVGFMVNGGLFVLVRSEDKVAPTCMLGVPERLWRTISGGAEPAETFDLDTAMARAEKINEVLPCSTTLQ